MKTACRSIRAFSSDRVFIIPADDPLRVNALQRRAAVVLQKSLREGFGLTVSEAYGSAGRYWAAMLAASAIRLSRDTAVFWSQACSKRRNGSACCWTISVCGAARVSRAVARVRRHFMLTHLLEE